MLWGSKKTDSGHATPRTADSGKSMTRTDTQTQSSRQTGAPGSMRTTAGLGKKPTEASRRVVPRDELPRFLVMEGHISEADVRNALKIQQETGEFFGEVLAKEGVLGSQSLVSFLAKHCKIPHIGLLDYLIDKSLLALIPEELCWKFHLLPVDKLGRNLTIAMVNPLNNAALLAVREICPDLRIKPILCSNEHFFIVAEKLFGEHEDDDDSWADVPVAAAATPSAEGSESTTSTSSPEETSPEAESAPTATEESAVPEISATTTPPPEVEKTEKDTGISQDSNKLLESVFGAVTVKEAVSAENEDAQTPPAAGEENTLESIMHTFTDAMVNSMHDTYELLARKISFFKGVSPEDVAKIFAQGNVVEYEPAQMLFDKGDSGDTMYVILNGRVKIRDGAKQIAILQTGDIFGEMSLVSDEPRSATAVTMTQSDLLVLSFNDILNKITPQVSAQLLINVIVTLADRLRKANQNEAETV